MTDLAPIAVLDADPEVGQVLWKAGGGSGRLHGQYESFPQLVYLADLAMVYQLWITPRWLAAHPVAGLEHAWNVVPTEDERRRVAIVAPSLDDRLEAFCAPAEGSALLHALEMLEAQLGTWWTATPGRVAEVLVRTDLRRRGRHEPVELPAIVTGGHVEAPFDWVRPLMPHELELPYVVAVDKHAAYLVAMGHLELGIGEPERITEGSFPAFDRRLPGYWHVRTKPMEIRGFPDPTRPRGAPGRREDPEGWRWLTTPSVRAADELGLLLELDEAYVWRTHGRLLSPFAQRLRAARDAMDAQPDSQAARIALAALKRVYATLIGRLRMVRESGPDPLFRPDWHDHLVAEARVNLFRNLRLGDEPPAACAIDAWYFPSATPEQTHGLRLGRRAGEYSVKVVPLELVAEAFNRRSTRELMQAVASS